MKYNRRFIYFVIILLVINLGVFFSFKYLKADEFFKKRITKILENSLDVDVKFKSFSINDKQIFITNLNLTDRNGEFKVFIKNLYVDYNLLYVMLSQFSNVRIVNDIRIYDPDIRYTLNLDKKGKKKSPEIPDLSQLFKRAVLKNGKVSLIVKSNKLNYTTSLDSINIEILNKKLTTISMLANSSDNSQIKANMTLNKSKLKQYEVRFGNFKVNKLKIKDAGEINSIVNAYINYSNQELYYQVDLINPELTINKEFKKYLNFDLLAIHDLNLKGTKKRASINFNFNTNNHFNGKMNLKIRDPFSKPVIHSEYELNDFSVPELTGVKGLVDIKGDLTYYKKLQLNAGISSDSISYQNERFTNISLKVSSKDIINGDIQFKTNDFKGFLGSLSAQGAYSIKKNRFNVSANADSVSLNVKGLKIKTTLDAKFDYNKNSYEMSTNLKNADLQYQDYYINAVSGNAKIVDGVIDLSINNTDKSLAIDFKADTEQNIYKGVFKLNDFQLNSLNKDLSSIPIKGRFELDYNDRYIDSDFKLAIQKNSAIPFTGKIDADFYMDKIKQTSQLDIKLHDAEYQKQPLSLVLKAKGDMNTLKTNEFVINDLIHLESVIGLQSNPFIHFTINEQKLPITQLTRYVLDENTNRELSGFLNIKLDYDSRNDKSINSEIKINDAKYNLTQALDINCKLSGSLSDLALKSLKINYADTLIAELQGSIKNMGESINLKGKFDAQIDQLISEKDAKGLLKADFEFDKKYNQMTMIADIDLEKFLYKKYKIDQMTISIEQKEDELLLKNFKVNSTGLVNITGNGSMNYNLFTDQSFGNQNSIRLNFDANPLLTLSKHLDWISSGDSKLNGFVDIAMNEDGLIFKNGKVNLVDGYLKIKGQQETIDKLNLDFLITDNELKINKFSGRMGKGYLYIDNKITNGSEDLVLGPLNMGQLSLKTDKEGLLFHMPYYSPNNSVANICIKGRYTDALLVKGPFDDIQIIGDVLFSNGSGVYPSDSENLLNYMSLLKNNPEEEESEEESADLPFNLDLILRFKENMKYVTYPLNLQVNPDSYLWLTYKDGDWSAYEALFIAESGEIEMFGTTFETDYVSVKITPYEYNPIVVGSFYKKASDGTIITLDVSTNGKTESFLSTLEFKLSSDNSDDKSNAQILSKLRYGKSLDELSQTQEQSILQDEAIQLVGVGIGSAFIDPYISPIENKVRRWLKLDNFNLNPGFVQNLFNEYKTDNSDKLRDQEKDVVGFSSAILLNNLSVNMGKYVTNNLFLNYEALFQEETDIFSHNRLFMYNNFSLRYDLPFRLKFLYEYQLLPNNKKDAHEVKLTRSFKF